MKQKLSVKIIIPGLNLEHDFLLPDAMAIKQIVQLILRILHEEYSGLCPESTAVSLFRADTGELLKETLTPRQLGIQNGDKLVVG